MFWLVSAQIQQAVNVKWFCISQYLQAYRFHSLTKVLLIIFVLLRFGVERTGNLQV